ncbi:MAG: NADH-quinone oxidoreductase subunit NuoE [Pseudomonadota bacterium]
MSLRRLHQDQPDSFAFTPANAEWAKGQIAKYPEGRQASAVIPLLWRAQEQEGWVSRPIIEEVAKMLGMASIRVLEVATFYFMFQLRPVGSVAHIQVCGTTSCMICGAEDLVAVCRERIAPAPHVLSEDGRFSWEEVECLGACANAPMVQIGKDYFEDLDRESFVAILDAMAAGEVPRAGSAKGRFASEPVTGLTSLEIPKAHETNGSVALADAIGDSIARIDGSEPTASDLALGRAATKASLKPRANPAPKPKPAPNSEPKPAPVAEAAPTDEDKPELLTEARGGAADDLKTIKGVGPKLEGLLNTLGVYHFEQIASWTDKEVAWVDYHLEGFKGRVVRDDWVGQAKGLISGGCG